VEAKEDAVRCALERLHPRWPRSVRIRELFSDVSGVMDDLQLLYRNGLIDLRLAEFGTDLDMERLKTMEREMGGYFTTPFHTREAA